MEKKGSSMTQRSRPSLNWLNVVDNLIMPPSVEDSRSKAVVVASPLFYSRKDGYS